jgi:Zn finger protein HypA/HybF involved in hydrogenase expression
MLPKDAARYVVNSVILLSSDVRQKNEELKKEVDELRKMTGMLETDDRYNCNCFELNCDNWWIEGDDTADIPNNPPHFSCDNCFDFRYCEVHRHLLTPHNGELWCQHCIDDQL